MIVPGGRGTLPQTGLVGLNSCDSRLRAAHRIKAGRGIRAAPVELAHHDWLVLRNVDHAHDSRNASGLRSEDLIIVHLADFAPGRITVTTDDCRLGPGSIVEAGFIPAVNRLFGA